MPPPIFTTDPYDRRVLLVSDKNNGSYIPIHKEDGTPFTAEDPGLPIMLVDGSGNYRILRSTDLAGGGGGSSVITDIEDGTGDSIMDPLLNAAQVVLVNPLPIDVNIASGGVVDTELPAAIAAAEGMANPTAPFVLAAGMLWNGTTWERQGSNASGTMLTSAARTATVNSSDFTNGNRTGGLFFLHVSAGTGPAGSGLRLLLQMKSPLGSSNYATVNSGLVVIRQPGVYLYPWYPGASAATSSDVVEAASLPLSRSYRVRVEHLDATSFTYSVSVALCE